MNDSDLEQQLGALAPAAPPTSLEARIAQDLAATRAAAPTAGVIARPARALNVRRWLRNLGWAAAGAATMLLGMMFLAPAPTEPLSTTDEPRALEEPAFEPAEGSRELLAVEEPEELIETADGPVREVRYTYRERMAWSQPGTGARLEIEVPREDVYLLPVSLQ